MTVGVLYLAVSLYGATFTLLAFRPPRFSVTVLPAFFASWLTAELAPQHIAWQVIATAGFVWSGALSDWAGWLGLAVSCASWAGLTVITVGSLRSRLLVERSLADGLGDRWHDEVAREAIEHPRAVVLRRLAFPFHFRRRDVERIRNVPYGPVRRRNLLDVYRPKGGADQAPAVLWVHGGGWIIGHKAQQGMPMIHDLAAQGYVCFSINYRLSPKATFPDHVVDVKRAIGWIKEHGHEYGADPSFLLVTGGSAGGHLASLAALTAGDPAFQPGFEDADTSIQACVPFYGVYDLTDRHGFRGRAGGPGFVRFLERAVMKVSPAEDPEAWRRASPLDRIHADAPPFFVIHGTHDVLVPVREAREFVRALRDTSPAPVAYLELPGTQHAFEVFHSLRTGQVIHGVERFAAWAYARWLDQRDQALSKASGATG